MFKWFKTSTLDPLSVSMAGAKLGDRVLVVGCSDPRLIAALAAKAGLYRTDVRPTNRRTWRTTPAASRCGKACSSKRHWPR